MEQRLDQMPDITASNPDSGDAMDEAQVSAVRDIECAMRQRRFDRVRQLARALDRLNAGEYGVCVECGGPVSLARLRALPEVETCIGCQVGLEQLANAARASGGTASLAADVFDRERSIQSIRGPLMLSPHSWSSHPRQAA